MIKAALLAAGVIVAIPALAQAQSATSSTPGQPGSRSMTQGSAGTMEHSQMNNMSTGAGKTMMKKKKASKKKSRSM